MQSSSLDEATARQIVQRTKRIMKHSVNVMDNTGTIIASGDSSRIYQRHEGAVLALTENRVVEIDAATARHLKGVRPGINLPIVLQNKTVGVVGVSGEPKEIRAYAELVKMAAELILEQVAIVTNGQWEKRYREQLVNQLISGCYDEESVKATFAYLKLDLTQPRVVLILELDGGRPECESLKALLEFFTVNEPDYLVTLSHLSEVILLKPIALMQGEWDCRQERNRIQRLLARLSNMPISKTIVGGYFPSIEGIRDSYLSAKATQAMAKRLKNKGRYQCYTEQSLIVLLNSLPAEWQKRELLKDWQKLVNSDRKGVMQETLKAYFDRNCDLTQTANHLHIHVNTLRYRLQKIEANTDLNINELTDIVRLYIGMKIHR